MILNLTQSTMKVIVSGDYELPELNLNGKWHPKGWPNIWMFRLSCHSLLKWLCALLASGRWCITWSHISELPNARWRNHLMTRKESERLEHTKIRLEAYIWSSIMLQFSWHSPSRKWNMHSWLTRFHTVKWTLANLQKSRWDMFKGFYGSNAKEMKSSDEQNDFVRYKEQSKIWIAQSHRVTREFWHHSVMHPSTLCSHIVNSLGLPASMH